MNWTLLQNSLLVSGLTTGLSVAAGFLAGLWLVCLEERWRGRFLVLAVIALVLPPFLVINCWLDLLGDNGILHRWLPVKVYSLGGTVWILLLLTWPITLLTTLSAWQRLEASQVESDPALQGTALVRWLLWPVARNAAILGAVLTFVLAINNFAVPTILQVKVFPAEAWLRYYNQMDVTGTLLVSWPLILVPMLVILLLRPARVTWPVQETALTNRALRRQLGPGWIRFSGAFTLLLLALSLLLPMLQLLGRPQTWLELPNVVRAVPGTVWNSFAFAAGASSLCAAIGLASWRWRIGSWLWLPFLVPGVLLGVGLILAFNRPAFTWLYGTAGVVVLAFTVRYLAVAWHGIASAMHGLERELTDAARLDGASGWALLRHVQWPQISPTVAAAWYITYLLCLWDVETLVLIMPPGRETLALRIFNLLHYGHNVQVNALCLLLLGVAVLPLVLAGLAQLILGTHEDA